MKKDLFKNRAEYIADEIFVKRWSPRSFLPEVIPDDVLEKIFDAARWSPSTVNEQPWLFYTAGRDAESFDLYLNCLNEGNRLWAKNAGLVGFLVVRKFFKAKDRVNSLGDFDCGSSWMSLTLQARFLGLYTHGLGGIMREQILQVLSLNSKEFKVIMGFVVGKIDDPDQLSTELRSKEIPSPRHSLEEIWCHSR